jgi:hypothetical protein
MSVLRYLAIPVSRPGSVAIDIRCEIVRAIAGPLASTAAVWDTRRVMLKNWFRRTVLSRHWLTFVVMGLAFFTFGVGTYNIFMLLSANLDLIKDYGWDAVMDGAARQLAELVITGYLSMAAYVVFKACEYRLAHDLATDDPEQKDDPAPVQVGEAPVAKLANKLPED